MKTLTEKLVAKTQDYEWYVDHEDEYSDKSTGQETFEYVAKIGAVTHQESDQPENKHHAD